jgi:hypothetical protein
MTMRRPKNNAKPLDAFIQRKAEIDAALARIEALSGEHFNVHPDRSIGAPSERSKTTSNS